MYEQEKKIEPTTQEEFEMRDRLFSDWKKEQRFFTADMELTDGLGHYFDNRRCREVEIDLLAFTWNGRALNPFDKNINTDSPSERRDRILTHFKALAGKDLPCIGVLFDDLKPYLDEECLRKQDIKEMRRIALESLIGIDTEADPRAEWAVQEWQKILRFLSKKI